MIKNLMYYKGLKKNQGFSLLEILVAFTIMAISLSIVLKIFSSGVNTAVISEDYMIATQMAESLMAKAGIETPLSESETTGIEDEKYHWLVKIENHDSVIDNDSDINLMMVYVQVKWDFEQQNGRMIELHTIKTQNKQ